MSHVNAEQESAILLVAVLVLVGLGCARTALHDDGGA